MSVRSDPPDSPDPGRPGSGGTTPIWVLVVALSAGSVVLATVVLAHVPLPAVPVVLPWWLLALGFLLAEATVVHYDFRRAAHSFSLSELPLVLGLFFASPQDLLVGVVLGAGVALATFRRQSGLKLVFNLAHFAFGACVAVVVFRALGGDSGTFTPVTWLAALVASLASSAVSTAAVLVAIGQSEGAVNLRRLPEQLALTLLTTAGGASLGLLAVGASWHHPAAVALLVVPVATFLLSHRSFVLQRQQRDSLEFLHRTALILDGAPDVVSALARMLGSACVTFRAEVAQLALLAQHDPELVLLVSASADTQLDGGYVRLGDLDPLLRRTLASAGSRLLTLSPPVPGPGGTALRSGMVAPLGTQAHPRGVILVGNRLGAAGAFRGSDLRLLHTLAAHVDVSLGKGRLARALAETAQRADRERENALVLQRGILPPALPTVPGAGVAVRYLPGTAGAEVGGDWYDVITLPGGDVGFAVGDVLGHDLEAAARMGQARSALRAYASDGHCPAAVVDRLNRLLVRTDPDFMGTCCYLQFSPARGTVTLVSAGHLPPLLLVPDARPRLVEVDANLPLGVDADVSYAETTLPLPPAATLVLYTDGLVETKTMPLDVGLSRLTALAPDAAGDLEVLADRIVASGPRGAAADDLTLLLLRHEPAAATAHPLASSDVAGGPPGAPRAVL